MKTPREILLGRHQAATPKLDVIRREIVGELNNKTTKERSRGPNLVSWFLGCPNTVWRELILPSRRIWAGLAAVWLVLAIVNISQRDHSPAGRITSAAPTMSFQEQQRWMNELFADRSLPLDGDRPKTFLPQPSSERRIEILVT